LIKNRCPINLKNNKGITALHLAIYYRCKDVVKMLIEYGCDVNVSDKDDNYPIHLATKYNDKNMIKLLIESESNNTNNIK